MACMNKAGLVPETDVTVITMASSGYAAAIEAGELQAAVSANPWSAKKLQEAGGVVIVDGTDDAAIEAIIGSASYELFVMMASDAYIAENPETVQKVVNAVAKAMQWMESATPEEIAENLLPLIEGAQEELLYDAEYDKERGIANYTGYHTESGYQAAINLTKLAGGITKDIPAEDIYDDSFLDAAWEALK
jgi:NitT/TauT family transport system substrate-binding protein